MTAIEHIDFAPRPEGFAPNRCNCGICVVGAGWQISHCARCGNPIELEQGYGWAALCAPCWNEVGP